MKKALTLCLAMLFAFFLASTAQAGTVSDDFNDGNADGWISIAGYPSGTHGNWRVESEVVVQDQGRDHFGFVFDNYDVSDQTVEAEVLWHDNGYAGITIWCQDANNWVHISYPYRSGFGIWENIDGNGLVYPTAIYPADIGQRIWKTLRIEADSTTGEIAVYLDDEYKFTHTVTTTKKNGLSGFNSGNAGGSFDDFKLTFPGPDTTEPSAPEIIGFKNPELPCGAVTNIHSTTVDWTDSTDDSGIAGYEYYVDYPLPGGGRGVYNPINLWTVSENYGSLNEGIHYIKVRAKDNAGNYSEWSNTCDITADWTAPLVTIESPENGDVVNGTVHIFGTIVEDVAMGNYNLAIYPGDADFMDFSERLEQDNVNPATTFDNEVIYQWDTINYDDGEYLIRLAARDKAGNRNLSGAPYVGGDDSQHVIKVAVNNTPDNKDDCKKDGWKEWLNPVFRNQGDCVSFVQTQGKAYMSRFGEIW